MVRTHPDPPIFIGGVAQLGERLLCKQEVIGSIPFTSTIICAKNPESSDSASFWFFARGCSVL